MNEPNGASGDPGLGRVALSLMQWIIPDNFPGREELIGDLLEQWEGEILPTLGPEGAPRWLWGQVLDLIRLSDLPGRPEVASPDPTGDDLGDCLDAFLGGATLGVGGTTVVNNPWLDGLTDLESLREHPSWLGGDPSDLAERVRADLRRRFAAGDRPPVADYLDAFPELRNDAERVLGLIYEEFCLREEAGEAPDPKEFYARYEPWRDSLASQLNYHQMLSQDAGVGPGAAPRFPEPGMHFLGFRLRAVLGQGGEARVFLADDENLGGRVIALRVSPDRGEEPSIMGRLDHPHIMPVLTVVRDPETGLRGHGMPYCPGRPLDEVLPRMESIPPETRTARTLLDADAPGDLAARCDGPGWAGFPRRSSYADACTWLAARLAEALGHAHERGILHLDVEPTNVLLSADGGPMLLGFNLAHDPHAPERAENALRGGTLPYMAPEQLEAFRDPERRDRVGPTADLYALGLVLRELLTGRRPEAPPANLPLTRVINDLLAQRLNGWPPIRVDNPQVPHALGAIVGRCLALDPADRYPDALALAEDLRGFLRRRPLVHARNPNRPERIGNWFRRNRLSLAVAASLLVGLASAAATVRDGHDSFAHLGSIISRALACDPTPPRADLSLRLVTNAEEDPPPHDAPIAPAITTYAMASRQSEAEHPMPRPLGGDR